MSSIELFNLVQKADAELRRRRKRKPKVAVRAKLVKVARQAGYSIRELFGDTEQHKTDKIAAARRAEAKRKVKPKYRDPSNPENTWTGRGSMPKWMRTLIDAGGNLAEMTIQG